MAPVPPNATSTPDVKLYSVACGGKTCVATGSYAARSGGIDGLLEVTAGGAWKPVSVSLPGMSAASQDVDLADVSCVSSGTCTAIGVSDGDGAGSAFITGSGTHWTAVKIPVPHGGAILDSYGVHVACATAASCTAVGEYVGTDGFSRGMVAAMSGKTVKVISPPTPGKGVDLENAVACPSAKLCAFVGDYVVRPGRDEPMLVTGFGTKWTARELPSPKGAPATPATQPVWLACPHACDTIGIYDGQAPYVSGGPA